MDKIAMLETAVLAMNRKIERLRADRKTEDHEIELLQLKLGEVERHGSVDAIAGDSVGGGFADEMNVQLDAEMARLSHSIDRLAAEPVVRQATEDDALKSLAQIQGKIDEHKAAVAGDNAEEGDDDENVELGVASSNFSIMPTDEADDVPCDSV